MSCGPLPPDSRPGRTPPNSSCPASQRHPSGRPLASQLDLLTALLRGAKRNTDTKPIWVMIMARDVTRRSVVTRVCLTVLGAMGLGGTAAQRASASVAGPSRLFRVSAIDHIANDQQVSVLGSRSWLPLECVPAGWQPLIGDSVAVGPSPLLKRTSAQQLRRSVMHGAAAQDLHPGQRLGGPNGPVITEATTITPTVSNWRSQGDTRVRWFLVAVTIRRSSDGRERVIAIREA